MWERITFWSSLGYQDAISPIMEEFIMFHDMIMLTLVFITISVGLLLMSFTMGNLVNNNLVEGQWLEWIWTLLPGVILLFVAVPSLSLLYMYDETSNYDLSIKAVGHQWYWVYEYGGLNPLVHESYMLNQNDLLSTSFRLLDVDCPMVAPYQVMTQLLVSSKDVLHAWTVPSLGIKADAIPGRINSLSLFSFRPGVFFGQCSEICGAYHSFMPIMVELLNSDDFLKWLVNNK